MFISLFVWGQSLLGIENPLKKSFKAGSKYHLNTTNCEVWLCDMWFMVQLPTSNWEKFQVEPLVHWPLNDSVKPIRLPPEKSKATQQNPEALKFGAPKSSLGFEVLWLQIKKKQTWAETKNKQLIH